MKLKYILGLAILGILDSLYLLKVFYSSAHQVCDINATFSCTAVSQSSYSQIFGIPVAAVGLLGYLLLALLTIFLMKEMYKKFLTPKSFFAVAFVGFLVQLYYTYLEFFVIHAFCIFCLISQAIILLIATLAYLNWKSR